MLQSHLKYIDTIWIYDLWNPFGKTLDKMGYWTVFGVLISKFWEKNSVMSTIFGFFPEFLCSYFPILELTPSNFSKLSKLPPLWTKTFRLSVSNRIQRSGGNEWINLNYWLWSCYTDLLLFYDIVCYLSSGTRILPFASEKHIFLSNLPIDVHLKLWNL